MGTTYYDKDGMATFLFGNVPINAVKKAFFTNKLGTVSQLLKMVYNSVTYDFQKTAQGGAVIFARNYEDWEFVAPDNRLDFTGYSNMTLGEALESMRNSLVANPIPAWEQFADWIYTTGEYAKNVVVSCTAYLKPVGGTYTQINAPDFSAMAGNTFVDLLDVLIAACEPIKDNPASMYKTADKKIVCVISLNNSSGNELINMSFVFRE